MRKSALWGVLLLSVILTAWYTAYFLVLLRLPTLLEFRSGLARP